MPTLEELAGARNAAAKKVTDWMHEEGTRGNLRHNSQAPAWPEYETAQKALDEAIASVPSS